MVIVRYTTNMARHSKWAQIKRQKAVVDAKRGVAFTKMIRTITQAIREKGPNPARNPALRLAIDRALAANMPKENIDRAIARAASAGDKTEIAWLEAYGPGGAALLIEIATDNRNRTVAEVRHLLSDHGGSLSGVGSVKWQFDSALQPKQPVTLLNDEATLVRTLADELEAHPDVTRVITNLHE